ncbi:MAG: hypothetical protein E4G96_06330 [Chrysiogenales bacterium]|nr:MAG: hypothetical protein E4G96_06330 [Chrysiogenales bacterium]
MKSLTHELESVVYTSVRESYPKTWDADIITASLFSGIKKILHGKRILTPGNAIQSRWRIYRHVGNQENAFCDTALIVQVSYHDGQIVRGVAFHDTAEKDPSKNTFSRLNKTRMKKIASVGPHSRIILYDYDPVTGMAFPSTAESIIGSNPHSWNAWMPYTHAVAVPTVLALALDSKSTGLYKAALPLTYQICYRYLYGLDLDHSKPASDIASGIKTDRGNPKFLVLIAASHGGAEPLDAFEYNRELYEHVG